MYTRKYTPRSTYAPSRAARKTTQANRRKALYIQRPRIPSSAFGAIRTIKVKYLNPAGYLFQQVGSTGSDTALAFDFRINSMVDVSDYSGAFDAYRLRKITAIIQGINGNNSSQTAASQPGPLMVTVIDPDDAINPTSYAALLNYGSSMIHSPMCNDVRHFTPRLALGTVAGNSGSNTGQANVGPMWIDFATTNVPHYGFKLYIPKATGAAAQLLSYQITFEVTIDLRFNN